MIQTTTNIAIELIRAWYEDDVKIRKWIVAAGVLCLITLTAIALIDIKVIPGEYFILTLFPTFISVAISFAIYGKRKSVMARQRDEKIEAIEKRYEEKKEPKAAWDLASIRLESYLDRNDKQVKTIFGITVIVMIFGFTLVSFGVWQVYKNPNALTPAIVAACSGIIINAIAATLLVIYRSTMQEAKEYVTILERINAVGMSVQILNGIESENKELKAQATAELAKQLLSMYSLSTKTISGKKSNATGK